MIAGRRRRVGACELVCCRPLNVIKIITSKKSLVISFVVHSWFCQSELRFCQIKVNLLAGHLEMTGKQIYLNLKNRKTNRLLAHTILRFYGSTFQNGQTVSCCIVVSAFIRLPYLIGIRAKGEQMLHLRRLSTILFAHDQSWHYPCRFGESRFKY